MQAGCFDIVVIGGGHAGVEAAWAAANLIGTPGSVALVTLDPSKIGVMSCNPAIGGLAKGQLVREIDALGGIMGLATDATGIQFRVLNTSKGPAVHGPRAQCDKHAYARAVQALIGARPEIRVLAGQVTAIATENTSSLSSVTGVTIQQPDGTPRHLTTRAVVLTTGTFMRGLMHTGESKTPGGRFGESPALGISDWLKAHGFELGRLKTGTPPRLKRSTIRWDDLKPQYGDEHPTPFSDLSALHPDLSAATSADQHRVAPSLAGFPVLPQIDCRETHTAHDVHELIRANLHRAPMYSGQIESAGPRYCPSIEDKVVRFADRSAHHIYLEPESLTDDWIYCNGISTSLPADVQTEIVRALPGCEHAEIYRFGYAVEYDMVPPHQIHATGETKLISGLFLAGQINGTSGYEEAAAQGLIAGVNAVRHTQGQSEWILPRHAAYIGVLMDDLVTKTPREPYRMFTSRAEHRLLLRADNAADRLTPIAAELGLLNTTELGRLRHAHFRARCTAIEDLRTWADLFRIDGRSAADSLRGNDISLQEFHSWAASTPDIHSIARSVWVTVHADLRYESYVRREQAHVRRTHEMESRRLPHAIDYNAISGLRNEARNALLRFRPDTFGQAGRLEGVTPADLSLVAVHMKRWGEAHGERHSREGERP